MCRYNMRQTKIEKKLGVRKVGLRLGIAFCQALVYFIFLAPLLHLHAQFPTKKFRRLSDENGLCHNNAYSIIQDSRGFIWIGTQDGLARYDGNHFITFRHNPRDPGSLSSGNFGKLAEGKDGVLWLGTWGGGLDRLDLKTGKFIHYKHNCSDRNSVSHNLISALVEEDDGTLWIGTASNGLDKFDPVTGKFLHYRHDPLNPNSLADDRVRAISIDNAGTLWIATYGGGLNRLNPETGKFTHYRANPKDPNTINNDYLRTLCLDWEGNLWLGSRGGGINKLNTQTAEVTRFHHEPGKTNSPSSQNINYIFQDSRGILWFGTYDSGLDRFDPVSGEFTHFRYDEKDIFSLSGDRIEVLYEDRSGVLWIGTKGGGVSCLDLKPPRFRHYHQEPVRRSGLSFGNVYAITQDREGNIWIGTDGGGLDKRIVNNGKTYFVNYKPDPKVFKLLGDNRIWSILEDRDGIFWVGTYPGLKIMDKTTGSFFRVEISAPGSPLLDDSVINSIVEDKYGAVWLGTSIGLFKLTKPSPSTLKPHDCIYYVDGKYYRINEENGSSANHEYISFIYEDSTGELWIATNFGLHMLVRETETFTHYTHNDTVPQSISHDGVTIIVEDKAGRFWVGTNGGLNEFDKKTGTFSHYFQRDGLPSNSIMGILEDHDGNLWVSTTSGLCRFNPDRMTFRNYDIHDGLLNNDFIAMACFKSKQGEMFFGGSRGVVAFFPGEVTDNPHVPPVVLTSFKVNNAPVIFEPALMAGQRLDLSYLDNFFSFEFAALDYTNPRKNQYAFKLEGFNQDWVRCGNRQYAEYTNVPPGQYTFRVIGSNNDGIWNQTGAALKIRIIPPFWETAWFRSLALIMILFFIYLTYRIRTSAVRKQKAKLETLVAQRTHELEAANKIAEKARTAAEAADHSKSDFLARMSHEMRTPLNSILGFNDILMGTKLDKAQVDYVKTVSQSGEILLYLVNDILDFSRIESGRLSLEAVEFNPAKTAFDVCNLMAPKIAGQPIDILCSIGDNVPDYVNGDPGRFRQVLINLMQNAVKFTEEGEIEITLDARQKKTNKVILITKVRDTGIGIPTDKQEQIFDVFQQADDSTSRKYGGSGLGLAICKQLSKLMGGDVRVESEPGKGSTFYFTALMGKAENKDKGKTRRPNQLHLLGGEIPVREKEDEPEPQELSPVTEDPISREDERPVHILMAEDNPINRKLAGHILTRAGYRLDVVSNGKEALDAYVSSPGKYDLILMDIQMPKMNGIEATREIRTLEAGAAVNNEGKHRIPIIAITAQALKGDREKCLDAGMDDFISKPIKKDQVIAIIAKWYG